MIKIVMFQFYISIDTLLMNCKILQNKSMAFQMEYRVPVTDNHLGSSYLEKK